MHEQKAKEQTSIIRIMNASTSHLHVFGPGYVVLAPHTQTRKTTQVHTGHTLTQAHRHSQTPTHTPTHLHTPAQSTPIHTHLYIHTETPTLTHIKKHKHNSQKGHHVTFKHTCSENF